MIKVTINNQETQQVIKNECDFAFVIAEKRKEGMTVQEAHATGDTDLNRFKRNALIGLTNILRAITGTDDELMNVVVMVDMIDTLNEMVEELCKKHEVPKDFVLFAFEAMKKCDEQEKRG